MTHATHDTPSTNGAAIRAARSEAKLSQAQVAAQTGLGLRTVIRAEQGRPVSLETITALASLLGRRVDDFLTTEAAA